MCEGRSSIRIMSKEHSQSELVIELAEEFIERFRRGERPTIAEYVQRHPILAEQIRETFPAMAMVEHIALDDESLDKEPAKNSAPPQGLTQIGDYRIIREVGRGGMGIVYEAEQISLGRRVAVKILPKNLFSSGKIRQRFERESKAAAKLHHTNIVPVFGVGEEDGLHYYVMQFIQGLGLDEVLEELRRQQRAGTNGRNLVAVTDQNLTKTFNVAPLGQMTAGPTPQTTKPTANPPHARPLHEPSQVSVEIAVQSLMEGRFSLDPPKSSMQESENFDSSSNVTNQATDRDHRRSPKENPSLGGAGSGRVGSETDRGETQLPPDGPSAFAPLTSRADTIAKANSETAGSGPLVLPGRSEATSQNAKPGNYYQSVANIGLQVADALQHAHQQNIIHRDVKPSNLLLDTRGNVWVTDFGLAKASDQRDLTQTGDVLGTLRYMAPEQFEGTADFRSDVYSLGLTLYELLAFRPAFAEKDRHKLIKQVIQGSPERLRSLDGRLPTDLTTIIHKAIERDPRARYQTAGELKDDLYRFLHDEPVHARRISPATRFTRWCKRNPAVASLTSAIAALLLVATIGSTFAATYFQSLVKDREHALGKANKANANAQREKADADIARNQAVQAAQQERTLRQEAELQRDRANTNFARARRAVDAYLNKVTDDELLSVPGLQPLRQELLAEALKFYAEFAQERTDDPELQIELATAQFRLGRIQRELVGKEAAQTANLEAIRQLESLQERNLGGVSVQTILAQAYFMASRFQDTIQLCKKVLETNPEAVEIRSTMAETYNSLAIDEKNDQDAATALNYHQQAFEIRQQLVIEHPENAEYNAKLAATINNIGVLLGDQKKTQDALAMFQLSSTYNAKACQLAPLSIQWGRWHANGLRNVGYKYRELGQQIEAQDHFQKSVEVLRRLVFQNPAVSSLRSDLFKGLLALADQQKLIGSITEANRSYRDAREVMTQIPRETPAELFQLSVVYASLASPPESTVAVTEDDPEAADERLRNSELALQTLQLAVDKGWADPAALKNYKVFDPLRENETFKELARIVESTAEANKLLASQAKTDDAKLTDQQKAADILGKLAGEHPQQIQHQRSLAAARHSIGVVQTSLKQFKEAEESLNLAIDVRAKVRDTKVDDPELTLDWLSSRIALGQLFWQMEQYPRAHQIWQECLAETERLMNPAPEDKLFQTNVVALERPIYERYGTLGLMPLVQKFTAANVRRLTLQAVDAGGFVTDGEFSAAMLLSGDREAARDYFQYLAESIDQGDSRALQFELVHLVRGACLLGGDFTIDEDVIRKVRQTYEQSMNGWIAPAIAMFEFRSGDFTGAGQTMERHATSTWTQLAFLDAAVAWKLGNQERAQQRWSQAEALYQRRCQEALSRSPLSDVEKGVYSTGVYNEHWWQFVYGQAMRQFAAEVLAEGQPVSDDPWPHLIQARGYRLIGENEKADAEIAAATAAVPDDPVVWKAIAHLQESWESDSVAAHVSWSKAVEFAGNDPLLWIERGHRYVERGEQAKADADFAKAASLTSNDLGKFLEAGWWVAGPYPAELEKVCPPELAADPSIPVHLVYHQSHLSDGTVKWQKVATEIGGRVNLPGASAAQDKMSYYAQAYVYSPDERSVMLLVQHDLPIRLWVNGRFVEQQSPGNSPVQPWYENRRIPITLRSGRNQILVKANAQSFYLRAATTPLDQALFLCEQRRFHEAAAIVAPLVEDQLADWRTQSTFCHIMKYLPLAISQDSAGYERAIPVLIRECDAQTDPGTKFWITRVLALRPNSGFDKRADDLIKLTEDFATAHPEYYEVKGDAALANYRARRFAVARQWIDKVPSDLNAKPIKALLAHQAGDHPTAKALLAEAREVLRVQLIALRAQLQQARPQPLGPLSWMHWIQFQVLLLEAEAAIDPDEPSSRAQMLAVERELADWWQTSPETMIQDLAVYTTATDGSTNIAFLQPYVARGKRLAELKRFDEAEADFNKAVELKPNDSDVLYARAAFYADRGDSERAVAEFTKAFGRPSDHPVGGLLRERRLPHVLRSWNFAATENGWQSGNQCQFELSDGILAVRSTGDDPQIGCDVWAPPGWKELTLCARVYGDLNTAALYWATSKSTYSEQQVKYFQLADSGGEWQVYRVFVNPDADLQSLRFDPENRSGLRIDLAWIVMANRTIEESIELNPNDGQLIARRGGLRLAERRWDEAAADFTSVLEKDPGNARYLLQRARAFLAQGDYVRALADAEALVAQNPNQVISYDFLAEIHATQGHWQEAIDAVDKQIELEPQKSEHWYKRAVVLATGLPDAYRPYCDELLAKYSQSDNNKLQCHVAWCCSIKDGGVEGNAKLLPLARTLEVVFPDDWTWSYPTTVIQYRNGQYSEALARLKRAVAPGSIGDSPWEWMILAMTHFQMGNRDEALKWFEKLNSAKGQEHERSLNWVWRLEVQLLKLEASELLEVESETPEVESPK